MPTLNSFRRVGPGCWTGSQASCEHDDKESAIRLLPNRLEYKLCDSTANLYLALAGILSAGLDGISSKLELDSSFVRELPTELESCLDILEKDQVLGSMMGPAAMKSYLAVRRAECQRQTSLEEEKQDALQSAL